MTGRILICGNTCGHNHESLNGPTGCCSEHGPYMYFCAECHDRRPAPVVTPSDEPVHWTGVFPSSLHGNGAGSFTATSRHWQAVTCTLCLSLRERSDDWPDSVTPSAEGDRCPTCGSDDEPRMTGCGFMCDDPGGWHAARPVTPSAEGSE